MARMQEPALSPCAKGCSARPLKALTRPELSGPEHLPGGPTPNTAALGVELTTCAFWGDVRVIAHPRPTITAATRVPPVFPANATLPRRPLGPSDTEDSKQWLAVSRLGRERGDVGPWPHHPGARRSRLCQPYLPAVSLIQVSTARKHCSQRRRQWPL